MKKILSLSTLVLSIGLLGTPVYASNLDQDQTKTAIEEAEGNNEKSNA